FPTPEPNHRQPVIPSLARNRQLRSATLAIKQGDRKNCAYASRCDCGRSRIMCFDVQLPPAMTTDLARTRNSFSPTAYTMEIDSDFSGEVSCWTEMAVAPKRIFAGESITSSAAKLTLPRVT